MSKSETDFVSSSESESISPNKVTKTNFSVLKHLPEARKIMIGQNYCPQSSKCIYQNPLTTIPSYLEPKNNS